MLTRKTIANIPPYRVAGMVGLFCLFLALPACTGGSKSATVPMEQLETLIAARYGSDGTCQSNPEGTLVLCQSAYLINETMPGIKFFVYNQEQQQIVYEQTDTCESVQWHDEAHLRITNLSGTVQRNSTSSGNAYVIDARTGEKKADM